MTNLIYSIEEERKHRLQEVKAIFRSGIMEFAYTSISKSQYLSSCVCVTLLIKIFHRFFMVDPLSYFSFQPVLHNLCKKGCGMCYPGYGMKHIKEPLLLIGKSSPCGGSRFPVSLSHPLPYVRHHITVNKMC